VHTHAFIPTVWFWRERREALSFVAIRRLYVHDEVRGGEYHECWIGGLAVGGSSLCTIEGLVWRSGFRSTSLQVGATTQVKFRVFTFQVENPRSSLNWLYVAMSLLKALF
jgi:hypothetical protein